MNTIDECSASTTRNNDLGISPENDFCNIINGEKIFIPRGLPEKYLPTNKQLAAVPAVEDALLAIAISAARNAFSSWDVVAFERRKSILTEVLNKIDEHANELSARLAAEQRSTLAEAKWEIDLLSNSFGRVLMQMEPPDRQQDAHARQRFMDHYVLIDAVGAVSSSKLSVILSLGKVFPALLAGETVVLRPSPFTPATLMRISEYVRELLPAGVFNVVAGGHDLLPEKNFHSGIDLIRFSRSVNPQKPAGRTETLELEDEVSTTDPGRTALFRDIAMVPIIRKPGRYGLANTLFEILSFPPRRMKTQVLVWSLARKASYRHPMLRQNSRPS